MSRLKYEQEEALKVVSRLKNSEDILDNITYIIDKVDNIKEDSDTSGLLENIDFKDLKDTIQKFKENNVIDLYKQILVISEIATETDIAISKDVEEKYE